MADKKEMETWLEYFERNDRAIFNQCLSNRRLIELVIKNTPKGGRVLEAGCGTAMLSLILADCGYELTAVDLSEDVLNYARERVTQSNISLDFIRGDILKLGSVFEEQYFETVCHSGVMEHFNDEDIVKGLSEQKKISRRVIFNIPNNRTKPSPMHFGDERFLDNKKWISLIKQAGFKDIKVYGGYDLPTYAYFILPGAFFHRKGSFWWRWFSGHSIFVCE